ncbi:MAG: cobaltochelatase subunit CobN, partial [Pseudomonadota bacterium]
HAWYRDRRVRWRATEPEEHHERQKLAVLIQDQASEVELADAEPKWTARESDHAITNLTREILELEYTLIPHGLHVIGETPSASERAEMLSAVAEAGHELEVSTEQLSALSEGAHLSEAIHSAGFKPTEETKQTFERLADINANLATDHELPALVHALDTGFIRPVAGGDLLRSPDTLPTGRNVHGFDPFRLPSAYAIADGANQAARLLARYQADGNPLPRTVAMVLWGTDNLKSEGGPIAQALALVGAEPRFDTYGRLSGANLIPLEKLSRPRIDVVVTLSGIFRDLLPLQTRMLAEAFFKAASADEPEDMNFARANALAYQRETGCDLETAALRVFSNADGAYGANVNQLIDSGAWDNEDELATAYTRRKCFAYGRSGDPVAQPELLGQVLKGVDLAYQNLESVELGVTTIDHYFDTLGGIGSAIQSATGKPPPVYIGDQTRGEGKVRLLSEQVALETRTRTLNPKWYEGMLKHGYEGVRQIEAQITNTMGWSATTGQVQPWVYQQITQTFVLDKEMRDRLATLNPKASAKVANRLLEAHERQYWNPDDETLAALRAAGEELEDRLEGITGEIAA